jgi:acyl-coenzyme A thioesterase PaaI-like protein
MTMIEENYRQVADFSQNGVEGIRRTGVRVLEMRERYVRMMMPIEGNTNHVGIMYAGSLFALGEVIGGALFGASFDYRKYFPIAKELSIRYRRPALTDVTLEAAVSAADRDAIARELEDRGKADIALDLELRDAGGEVVAVVHGVWQARKIPEGFAVPWAKA